MITALLLSSLAGCMNNGLQAPSTAFIQAPPSVEVAWDDAYNGVGDGIGAIVFADFLVYDGDSDAPLQNVIVEVTSNSGGACLVPPETLQLVDYPQVPDGASMADCTDENGNFDNETNEWCGWNYDTITGEYYQFGTDYADDGDYCPNYHTGTTDRYGLFRVYVYLDALATSGTEDDGSVTGFNDAQIIGSIGYNSDGFEIGPGDEN